MTSQTSSSPIVYDCEGPILTESERAFFREANPFGFILFARHCQSPDQLRALCDDLRQSVGRQAPILIDQEGGRVARMRAEQNSGWCDHPPMAVFGHLWKLNPQAARQAAWLNAYLLADMVSSVGISVNCVPSLDVPQIDSDPVTLGDRALALHPDIVGELGRQVIEGSLAGGALPVIKHMPGLGRARCDSHKELPIVTARREDLQSTDFKPFQGLNDAVMGMTAHVVYDAYDADHCATHSPSVIQNVIRGEIGFDGLLFSDDLKMEALGGSYVGRAIKALDAGCDIGLACNLALSDNQAIAAELPAMREDTARRIEKAFTAKTDPDTDPLPPEDRNWETLSHLLKPVWPISAV